MKRKSNRRILDPDFKKQIDKALEDFKITLYDLHDVATIDEKTEVYNHRFFASVFEKEMEKAWRGMQKLCLIIIDIDFFKKFNDKYGHLVGDKVLYELAQTMKDTLRKYDIIARYGGEEFMVLLPETGIRIAKKVAERLRRSPARSKKLTKYGVTISLGVTEYKSKDTVKKMIKRADKALYQSKKEGRDRVSVL